MLPEPSSNRIDEESLSSDTAVDIDTDTDTDNGNDIDTDTGAETDAGNVAPAADGGLPTMADLDGLAAELDEIDATLEALNKR